MKFLLEYSVRSGSPPASAEPSYLARVAEAAEDAGIGGVAFTEHPAPSRKWLEAGGHETFDPFVALAFCAARTTSLRLFTYLSVVPYRNPLLLAKSMSTLDVLSGGRTTFVLGTGYLRSEFRALGVDFDERNALFDESAEVIRQAWSSEALSFEGRGFSATDQVIHPAPVQLPHPPLWLGGNSAIVRERAALWAQGWAPLRGDGRKARTTRTPAAASVDELRVMITDLRERLERAGREPRCVDIVIPTQIRGLGASGSRHAYLRELSELAAAGATWTLLRMPALPLDLLLAELERFGREVVRG